MPPPLADELFPEMVQSLNVMVPTFRIPPPKLEVVLEEMMQPVRREHRGSRTTCIRSPSGPPS